MPEQQSDGLEGQIAQLERQLAEKRAELGGDVATPLERTEVHAVVGEQIRQVVPGYQSQATPTDANVPSWQNPVLAVKVQELVNVAFTESIQEAITQALKFGNPALVDALHDVLADQFHQELLNRRKIQPAP